MFPKLLLEIHFILQLGRLWAVLDKLGKVVS